MPADNANVAETIWYNEDSSAPLTVTKPAAFATGQLLLAVITSHGGTLADLTLPATWAEEGTVSTGTGSTEIQGKVASHVYTGSEPATWDFGYNSGADVCLGLFRIINPEPTPVIAVTSTGWTAATGLSVASMDSPSVDPSAANDLLICTLANVCGGTVLTETDPTPMSDLGQTQVAGNFMALAAVQQLLADASSTGVRTWTGCGPTGTVAATFSIAIKSSGLFDPDPPLNPPAPEIPQWLLWELLERRQQQLSWGKDVPPLTVDPGSPAAVRDASATTTVNYTPPDVCGIVAFVQADADDGSLDQTCTVSSTGGLTWSLAKRANGATDGQPTTVEVWYTYAATSPGAITISVTTNKGAVDKSVFVRGFTGVDPTVIGATAATTGATVTYTPTTTLSWGWSTGLGGNAGSLVAAANCTIADATAVAGFDAGDTIWTIQRNTTSPDLTNVVVGTNGALSSYLHHVAVEIIPIGGAIAVPATRVPTTISQYAGFF